MEIIYNTGNHGYNTILNILRQEHIPDLTVFQDLGFIRIGFEGYQVTLHSGKVWTCDNKGKVRGRLLLNAEQRENTSLLAKIHYQKYLSFHHGIESLPLQEDT